MWCRRASLCLFGMADGEVFGHRAGSPFYRTVSVPPTPPTPPPCTNTTSVGCPNSGVHLTPHRLCPDRLRLDPLAEAEAPRHRGTLRLTSTNSVLRHQGLRGRHA